MTDRETIIARYEREEARLGDAWLAEVATAKALGISYEDVWYTMLEHWIETGDG